jgi:chemotaxis signal transduction protein
MGFHIQELVLPPTHLSGQFQEAIEGAFKLPNNLLIILDTKAIARNAQHSQGDTPLGLHPLPLSP